MNPDEKYIAHKPSQDALDKLYEMKREFVFINKEFFDVTFKELDKLFEVPEVKDEKET